MYTTLFHRKLFFGDIKTTHTCQFVVHYIWTYVPLISSHALQVLSPEKMCLKVQVYYLSSTWNWSLVTHTVYY